MRIQFVKYQQTVPDKLSGKKAIVPDSCPFCTGQCPCPAAYFQACTQHPNTLGKM
jgi:hypothetical protein